MIENAIWAKILGIHNVALNLGPKLLGLYKKKQFGESEAVSRQKNQSIWGVEYSFVLYISFIFFYFSFLRILDLALNFNLVTGPEIVNCSEVELNG